MCDIFGGERSSGIVGCARRGRSTERIDRAESWVPDWSGTYHSPSRIVPPCRDRDSGARWSCPQTETAAWPRTRAAAPDTGRPFSCMRRSFIDVAHDDERIVGMASNRMGWRAPWFSAAFLAVGEVLSSRCRFGCCIATTSAWCCKGGLTCSAFRTIPGINYRVFGFPEPPR